jgi:membrane protein YdbS with pleckstrin-like domain
MEEEFSNKQVSINSLPDYRAVEFQPISIKKRTKIFIQISIAMFVFLIGWGVFFYFTPSHWAVYLPLGGILLFFGLGYLNAHLQQPKYGYALREKDILYRRGFIVTKTTVIPFNRIQHVSISRGILDKSLGISTLKIFTAGGQGSDVNIPGLLPDLAKKLKEALAAKIVVDERE